LPGILAMESMKLLAEALKLAYTSNRKLVSKMIRS
jgi:hypothetical protein